MNNLSTEVFNSSKEIGVRIKLTSPEDANEPTETGIAIFPGTKVRVATQGGTMNLFIWEIGDNQPLLWKGIVPTKVDKSLVIIPEEKKVMYEGIELPDNFRPVTNLNGPGFSIDNGENNMWTYFILAAVIVIVIIGFLWYGGYLHFLQKGKK